LEWIEPLWDLGMLKFWLLELWMALVLVV